MTEDTGARRQSGTPPYWARGTTIGWCYRRPGWRPGEPETVHPMTVVRDDADGLAAWLAPGTPIWFPVRADGARLRNDPSTMFTAARVQGTGLWHGHGILRVALTGRAWSVWYFRGANGSFDCYYVNIEDPHVRDERCLYTSDHVLDVEVTAGGRHARKDEDELVEAVRQGRYSAEEADRIRAVADEVESVVERWRPPFSDGWETFVPDPAWPVPTLDEVRVTRASPASG
jgi:predicted RNA-binding protein associated with RNAse of E/G family